MVIKNMNIGDGHTSYANNSRLPKAVVLASLSAIDETLKVMFSDDGFPECLRIVDLGCSSGQNTIIAISHILDKIQDMYQKRITDALPKFEVFLNDLPDNDFNNLFKLLPSCTHQEKQRFFWYGLPGSFYDRLFPNNTLHFAFSCYSLHWLSQIPGGLENKNMENIYIGRTTPSEVKEAYAKQFESDFARFLKMRGKEMMAGGRMVLILVGSRGEEHSHEYDGAQFTLLAKTLLDMVVEGHVKREDLYSFNVPVYFPCEGEVERVVRDEGSFDIYNLQIVPVCWDASGDIDEDRENMDKHESGERVAKGVRAFMEQMVVDHFGSSIVDEVFERLEEKAIEHPNLHEVSYWNLVIPLCKR